MEKFNSASRLHKIFTHPVIKNSQDKELCINVWDRVFSINDKDEFSRNFLVGNRLMLISKEILYIDKLAKENGISKEYLEKIIHNIKLAIAPTLLGKYWANTRNLLGPEIIVGLEGLANMSYFDNQFKISAEDLAEVQKLVDELSNLIKDSNIGERLRAFLLSQIQNMNSAIAEYSICGSIVFKSFFKSSIEQNYIHNAIKTLKEEDSSIYEKFMSVSKKIIVILVISNACISNIKEYEENIEYLYDKTHIEKILSFFDSKQEGADQSYKFNYKSLPAPNSKPDPILGIEAPSKENDENIQSSSANPK